ncbi:SHOCT domain-containing protein [Nocardia suismassiliense]|uniref:SHOCT domain-containing protein n=1 Tax=Nocardia suismassiliense TaxID=2077092 RepID=A0ABW6R2Y5_9NOCA
MTISNRPEVLTFLADHYDGGWHPWPFFWIVPLLFWIAVLTVAFLARRRFAGRAGGVGTLRTAFARGEITEDEYRSRLAVLREPDRPAKS